MGEFWSIAILVFAALLFVCVILASHSKMKITLKLRTEVIDIRFTLYPLYVFTKNVHIRIVFRRGEGVFALKIYPSGKTRVIWRLGEPKKKESFLKNLPWRMIDEWFFVKKLDIFAKFGTGDLFSSVLICEIFRCVLESALTIFFENINDDKHRVNIKVIPQTQSVDGKVVNAAVLNLAGIFYVNVTKIIVVKQIKRAKLAFSKSVKKQKSERKQNDASNRKHNEKQHRTNP